LYIFISHDFSPLLYFFFWHTYNAKDMPFLKKIKKLVIYCKTLSYILCRLGFKKIHWKSVFF